ncbi:Hypothetical predicted protein [Olea europaea subsp. europaea]|uniref:Uncharacterized protein n=1 Tax=Olea europaea subsp. europaea TaxID=158383 RepID=A0A8S0Q6G5_OLEEU|nr:Hypothetical predicted protein [Olea europaea subsp. europaea]
MSQLRPRLRVGFMHMVHSMRKLCPNLDKEDGLETVLEVPIPEEMFNKMGSNAALRWKTAKSDESSKRR